MSPLDVWGPIYRVGLHVLRFVVLLLLRVLRPIGLGFFYLITGFVAALMIVILLTADCWRDSK